MSRSSRTVVGLLIDCPPSCAASVGGRPDTRSASSIRARLEGHLRTAGVDRVRSWRYGSSARSRSSADGRPGRPAQRQGRGCCWRRLLVHANQVVSVDRLFEFLWRGDPPDTAANTLQTYVSHLRRSLEPDRPPREPSRLLITREPGYSWPWSRTRSTPSGSSGWSGRRGWSSARRRTRRRRCCVRALSLWRGEPLADFTFEPFAQAEITRLDRAAARGARRPHRGRARPRRARRALRRAGAGSYASTRFASGCPAS